MVPKEGDPWRTVGRLFEWGHALFEACMDRPCTFFNLLHACFGLGSWRTVYQKWAPQTTHIQCCNHAGGLCGCWAKPHFRTSAWMHGTPRLYGYGYVVTTHCRHYSYTGDVDPRLRVGLCNGKAVLHPQGCRLATWCAIFRDRQWRLQEAGKSYRGARAMSGQGPRGLLPIWREGTLLARCMLNLGQHRSWDGGDTVSPRPGVPAVVWTGAVASSPRKRVTPHNHGPITKT